MGLSSHRFGWVMELKSEFSGGAGLASYEWIFMKLLPGVSLGLTQMLLYFGVIRIMV